METKLTDRIVVEFNGSKPASEIEIAEALKYIAQKIYDGYSGSIEHTDHEVLWQFECEQYGGFRIVSDKSLIRQYYYHKEPAPRIISEELFDSIKEFNKDYDENEQEVGEDIDTKTTYLCDAVNLLANVEHEAHH